MAKLPTLVTALSATDGRERVTLNLIARSVREAGLIATTKRGGGASDMTARDAALLVIAANAVQHPKWAAMAAAQFRTFKQSPHGRREQGGVFGRLAQADTLGDALAVLIEEAGAINTMFEDWVKQFSSGKADVDSVGILRPTLSVTFSPYYVSIRVQACNGEDHEWLFDPDVNLMFVEFYTFPGGDPDRIVSTTIGLSTFLSLHRALFPSGSP